MSWRKAPDGFWRRAWPVLLLTVVVGALVLPPIATLLRTSLAEPGTASVAPTWTLRYYAEFLGGPKLGIMALNSGVFACCATFVSLVLGGVLAWLVERTDVSLKGVAYVTTIVSLGTPYILYVAAWLFLFGRSGPFNDAWRSFVDPGVTLFNVNSLGGMIAIEGLLWSPLVFLMLSAVFRAANAEMEEAARMSGATALQTVMRVSLRLASPAILALALFVFIRNLESFEVPALVGMPGRVDVLTTKI